MRRSVVRQRAVLAMLKRDPQPAAWEIAGQLSASLRLVRNAIRSLEVSGMVRRIGKAIVVTERGHAGVPSEPPETHDDPLPLHQRPCARGPVTRCTASLTVGICI